MFCPAWSTLYTAIMLKFGVKAYISRANLEVGYGRSADVAKTWGYSFKNSWIRI